MDNKTIIEQFYTAFAGADAKGMVQLYADDIQFEDPAFGKLKGESAKNMWRMLVNPGLKLVFSNVWVDGDKGGAHWRATYTFSKTGRKVVNEVDALFHFNDGKIIAHTDTFSFWKWSRQALGMPGLLLGWTSFLQHKVRQQALAKLKAFQAK